MTQGVLHSEVICSYSPEMDSSASNNNTSWKTSNASIPCSYTIQTCHEMYFRGLRGVRGVGNNKHYPNFILTLENTENQLQGCVYIYIYMCVCVCVCVCMYVCMYVSIYTTWLPMKSPNCYIPGASLNRPSLFSASYFRTAKPVIWTQKVNDYIFKWRSAVMHVWTTGLSQNTGGRPTEISTYIV